MNTTWNRLTQLRSHVLALVARCRDGTADLRAEVMALEPMARSQRAVFSRQDVDQMIAEGMTDVEIVKKTKLSKQRINQIRHRKAKP